MADRVVAMSEDAEGVHYLWDTGFVVTMNRDGKWSCVAIPTPTAFARNIVHPDVLNREASPDVAMVDD